MKAAALKDEAAARAIFLRPSLLGLAPPMFTSMRAYWRLFVGLTETQQDRSGVHTILLAVVLLTGILAVVIERSFASQLAGLSLIVFSVAWLRPRTAFFTGMAAALTVFVPIASRAEGGAPLSLAEAFGLFALVALWGAVAFAAAAVRRRSRLLLVLVTPLALVALAETKALAAEKLDSFRLSSFYLPMRDGVRLAVDLYLPRGAAQAGTPAILQQTRYYRRTSLNWPFSVAFRERLLLPIRPFVDHGYAYVVVDVRGSGASFGTREQEWSEDEVRDGAQVVDWIVRQPWSNQAVGSTGISYDGTSAEMLVRNRHPAVKAVAPRFSLFDVYTDIAFPGGLHHDWFTKTWRNLNNRLDRNDLKNRGGLFMRLAVRGVPPVDADRDGSLLRAAIADHARNYDVHRSALDLTFRDDKDWRGRGVAPTSPYTHLQALRAANTPMYVYAAWFDGAYPRAALSRQLSLATPGSKLVIGPWDHEGERIAAPHAPADSKLLARQLADLRTFFDFYLKGIQNGWESRPAFRYYTMGANQWRVSNSWPPAAQRRQLYFAPGGGLSSVTPVGDGADTYTVDNTATSGKRSRWNGAIGADVLYLDRAAEDRKLLTYTTAPLPADMEVTGHPVISLRLESDKPDAQLFVYLEEVAPNGRVTYVTEGSLRALHRRVSGEASPYPMFGPYHSFRRSDGAPMAPGTVEEISFDLLPTSYTFRRGNRLRVAVSGADSDHVLPMPGAPARWRVHRSATYPSRIMLPIV